MKAILSAVVLACVSLCGCSTIYRTVSIDSTPATSVNIDAKERMILVTDKGGTDHRRVVCAEPSPDTAVGLAASSSLAASVKGQVDAKLASSLAEAVQSIGRRTQTIQLLRDGLYRACEAYLNGAITHDEYRLLLSRISAFSVTVMAIDGLTGGQGIHDTSIVTKSSAKTGGESAGANGGLPAAAKPTGEQPAGETEAEAGGGAQPATSNATVAQDNVNAVVDIVKAFYALQQHIFDTENNKTADAGNGKGHDKAVAADEALKKP